MYLSNNSVNCIEWWIQNLSGQFRSINMSKPDRIIESDSSGTGFGARDVTHGQVISGLWNADELQLHINVLELMAAFNALKALCYSARNEHIQLYLDYTTAIKFITKMGGRKKDLNDTARDIWLWCNKRNIILSA